MISSGVGRIANGERHDIVCDLHPPRRIDISRHDTYFGSPPGINLVIDSISQLVSYYDCATSSHEDVLSLEPKSRDRLGFLVTQNHDFGGRLAPAQPSLNRSAGLNIAIPRHHRESRHRIASAVVSDQAGF